MRNRSPKYEILAQQLSAFEKMIDAALQNLIEDKISAIAITLLVSKLKAFNTTLPRYVTDLDYSGNPELERELLTILGNIEHAVKTLESDRPNSIIQFADNLPKIYSLLALHVSSVQTQCEYEFTLEKE